MQVVSYYFKRFILLPYYFLCSKAPVQHNFVPDLYRIFRKNRKKSANFLQFFLSVYQ